MDVALTDKDVLRYTGGRCRICTYPELKSFTSIQQLLGAHNACVILFMTEPNYGHWCTVFLRGDLIEFFNPYGNCKATGGGFPDDGLDLIDHRYRESSGQAVPVLSLLMLKSPYKLSYNEHQFQALAPGVKTCGRHCVVRLNNRNLPLFEYARRIYEEAKQLPGTPDELVVKLTHS